MLDPKGLADEGLTRLAGEPDVNNVQVKSALKLMLKPLGLTYKVEDEVVLITSPQANPAETYVKTYYVGDLVMPPDQVPRRPMPHAVMEPRVRQRIDADDGPHGFRRRAPRRGRPPAGPVASGVGTSKGDRRMVDLTPMVQLIATSIAPGTWQVHDGYGRRRHASRTGWAAASAATPAASTSARPIGCHHAVLPQHQPDHPPHGRGPRAGRRPAPPAPPAPGPSGLDRGPVHHRPGQLLRADRRRLRLPDPVRHGRQAQHVRRAVTRPQSLFPIRGVTGGLHHRARHDDHDARAAGPPAAGPRGGGTTGGGSDRRAAADGGAAAAAAAAARPAAAAAGHRRRRRRHDRRRRRDGGTGGTISQPVYLVNPVRDHAYGSNAPLIVGTQGGGIGNFSPNLDIPFTNTQASLIAPTFVNNYQSRGGCDLRHRVPERPGSLSVPHGRPGRHAVQRPPGPEGHDLQRCGGDDLQQHASSTTSRRSRRSSAPVRSPIRRTVGAIPSGVTLTVTPVVSADRRYVRLTLTPFFNAVERLHDLTSPRRCRRR